MIVLGLKAAGSHSRTSVRQAQRYLLLCHLFGSLRYTFGADFHAFKNLLVQPAGSLVTALKEQRVGVVKAQLCRELGKNSGSLKPKLVRESTHFSALQLERPKPYFTGEPRADKCKLSVLCSRLCAQPGGQAQNKTIFTLPSGPGPGHQILIAGEQLLHPHRASSPILSCAQVLQQM